MIKRKAWDNVILLTGSMIIAGIISVLSFPAMVQHIFSGYRGVESVENLVNASAVEYSERIVTYWHLVNDSLFGGYGAILGLFFVVCILSRIFNKLKKEENIRNVGQAIFISCIYIVPSILYFLLIAKIAVYKSDRYMFPIYVLLLLWGYSTLIWFFNKEKIGYIFVIVFVILIAKGGVEKGNWEYLYTRSEALLEFAETKSDIDCLYIFPENVVSTVQPTFFEISKYNSVTFLADANINNLKKCVLVEEKELILMISILTDQEEILRKVMELCPCLTEYEVIGTFENAVTYRLFERTV